MTALHRCNPDHPYCPADWRWQRARYLSENRLRILSRKYDDKHVITARKLKEALDSCDGDIAICRLMEQAGDVFMAHDIWYQDDSMDGAGIKANPTRYEIEAAILAGAPFEKIAVNVGTTAGVISMYECLFFNVVDRLPNRGYIINQIIGPAIHRGLSDRDYDLLWKLVGYLHGEVALECFISTVSNPLKVERPDQMQSLYVDGTKEAMRRKSYIAARTLPINSYTQVQILELYNRQVEIEKSGDTPQTEHQIMQNIETAIMAMPWAVGRTVSTRMDENLKRHYDTSVAVDLRSEEILSLGMGENVQGTDDFKDFKYPAENRPGG